MNSSRTISGKVNKPLGTLPDEARGRTRWARKFRFEVGRKVKIVFNTNVVISGRVVNASNDAVILNCRGRKGLRIPLPAIISSRRLPSEKYFDALFKKKYEGQKVSASPS